MTLSLFLFSCKSGKDSTIVRGRRAQCPAYNGIDPAKTTPNPNLEPIGSMTKAQIEKKKKQELNKVYDRRKSTSLFPTYMRKKYRG